MHLWCLLLAVIFITGFGKEAEGCLSYNDIKELFLEGSSASIKDESCHFQGVKSPTLEDLSAMFNDLSAETVPQYIQNNGYSFSGNFSGTHSYSYGHKGFMQQSLYGLFQKEGKVTTHSALDFIFFHGAGYTFSYSVGQALFTHVRYTKEDQNTLVYNASTLGALVFRLPDGKYILYGNYEGIADGSAKLIGGTISHHVEIVGNFENNEYRSRDISYISTNVTSTDLSQKSDTFSTTGGTNNTMFYSATPLKGNVWSMDWTGNLVNSDEDATAQGNWSIPMDMSKPLSDQNLPNLFASVRLVIGTYLQNDDFITSLSPERHLPAPVIILFLFFYLRAL